MPRKKVVLSPRTAERVELATRNAEALLRPQTGRTPTAPVLDGPNLQWVKPTSGTPSSGRYPAVLARFNDDKTFTDEAVVWTRAANGNTLASGEYYLARQEGDHTDGTTVYVVDDAALGPHVTATGTLNTVPKVTNATGPVYGDSTITDNGSAVTVTSGVLAVYDGVSQGQLQFGPNFSATAGGTVLNLAASNGGGGSNGLLILDGSDGTLTLNRLDHTLDGAYRIRQHDAGTGILKTGQWGTDAAGNVVSGGIITTLGTASTLTLTVGTTPVSGATDGQLLAVSGGNLSQPASTKVTSGELSLKGASGKWVKVTAPAAY